MMYDLFMTGSAAMNQADRDFSVSSESCVSSKVATQAIKATRSRYIML